MLVIEEKNLGEDTSSSQSRNNNSEKIFYSNRGRGRGRGAGQGRGHGRGNQNQGQQQQQSNDAQGLNNRGWGQSRVRGSGRKNFNSGFMFSLGSAAITWSSKKQPTVALSSTEVEYRSVAVVACEVAWLEILLDLGIQV